jgi:hypothetical protein
MTAEGIQSKNFSLRPAEEIVPKLAPDTKEKADVPNSLFDTIRMLEAARLHFTIERTRPDTIRLNVTLVGLRLEIDVFEDDHIEFAQFRGNERVETSFDELQRIIAAS